MDEEIGLSKIYRKSVVIANKVYNLAITPELCNDKYWRKNNEFFRGILNSEGEGNIVFEIELNYAPVYINKKSKKQFDKSIQLKAVPAIKNCIIYPDNINPEIVTELVKMTNKFHSPEFR